MNWTELKLKISQYCTPPGNGVFAVSSGKDKRAILHKAYYQTTDDKTVQKLWMENLDQYPLNNGVTMIGIPSDAGGGIMRGANWGPLYLRQTLVSLRDELPMFDLGDIRVNPHFVDDKYLNQETLKSCRRSMYGDENSKLPISPLSITSDLVKNLYQVFPHKRIFAIGGDHSVSYPLVQEYLKFKKLLNKKAAIIHFDAHTDLLSERLGVDLTFGSWAGNILAELGDPSLLIQVGIRASGKTKEHWKNTLGVSQFWAKEIQDAGIAKISEEIVAFLKSKQIEELYVTFDVDALSSEYVSATGTPEPGGLSPHEPMYLLQELYEHFAITGADLVEIAPLVRTENTSGMSSVEPESTLMIASQFATFLIGALYGKPHGHR